MADQDRVGLDLSSVVARLGQPPTVDARSGKVDLSRERIEVGQAFRRIQEMAQRLGGILSPLQETVSSTPSIVGGILYED